MADRRGFSLIEIIVALVIVGISAMVIIPNVMVSMEQTKARAARNNLLAISAGQQKYSEDNNGSYCVQAGCGDSTANLNAGLRLGISDQFSYTCSGAILPYSCTASDGIDTLTLTVSAATMAVSVSCTAGGTDCPS